MQSYISFCNNETFELILDMLAYEDLPGWCILNHYFAIGETAVYHKTFSLFNQVGGCSNMV